MNKHLKFKDGKSDKFWSIEVTGTSFTVTSGKTGTEGQTSTKEFDTKETCMKEAEKLVKERLKKGYKEIKPLSTTKTNILAIKFAGGQKVRYMTKEETVYLTIGKKLNGAEQSQMFGKPCFKINGKAFICFFQNEMVFKLTGDIHREALNLHRSRLFDPSGKKRPMKEWVQISADHLSRWEEFAKASLDYVGRN